MMALILICAVAATLGGAIVTLTIVVLAATRRRGIDPGPAARYAGDHSTVT